MADFAYTAIAGDGRHTTGLISSADRPSAVSALRGQGLRPLTVRESKTGKKGLKFKGKVGLKDLVIFTRELSTMVSAGVPLPRSLETLAGQTENKFFKGIIHEVVHDVESGMPLADALAKHPHAFSEIYVNMVRAGEAGGILDDILKKLATQVEKDATIRKKIKSAMAYPIVILTVTIIAFFGIMLFIVPKIGKIFKDLGGPNAQLPVYTRAMLSVSDFLIHPAIIQHMPLFNKTPIVDHIPDVAFIIVLFFVIVVYIRRYIHTERGSYKFHHLLLRVPILGPIIIKIVVARFARTFASLMGAGVSVLEALQVTGKAVGNHYIQKELEGIAEAVRNGKPLGKQLLAAEYFPPIVGQMVSVGEETGKTDEILLKVADFYEEEVDAVIDGIASIIEPVMIIVLGAIVGLIAASVMGPIANLSKNIGS